MEGGAMADQFQLLEELGSGSFGIVYKGIERATGDIVAIKHIDLESSDDDIQDIQQEISVLSTCDSPFVTQYKASFLRGHKLWIVMEYLGGGSCLDLLKAGTFDEACVAVICREILLGLDYLHKEGKIHRDVKAANILLAQSGKVKLADFGVAAQLTNIKSQRNTFVGTPFWMAPEVIQQAGYDFKADIWSLGVTAMELVQGEPPNASTHPMKALFLIPKAPAPRLEGDFYSRDLKDFVAACLVKDPDRRPSAAELLQHRFVRSAGQVAKLQELIFRRQTWDLAHGREKLPRFYEETMNGCARGIIQDDWVFDTVKASITSTQDTHATFTQKRRKISQTNLDAGASPEEIFQKLSLNESKRSTPASGTAIRVTTARRRVSALGSSCSTKREASGTKRPLAPSTDYGNSASKQPRSQRAPDELDPTKESTASIDKNPQSIGNISTKEAQLGRRAFSRVIDPAFQDSYAHTRCQTKQEALSRVAEAWYALNQEDAEGGYVLLKTILQKTQSDPKLASLLSDSQPSTPQKPKLVLAQSNPHLKSHRRRQSSLLEADDGWLIKSMNLPGQLRSGMEHTKQLADVLYSKWTEGLSNRWPNI